MTDPNATSRPTQAVILAGGQGSRLRPYTDDRPKPMVEIPGTGTPIIGHQLVWLAEEGVTDVVVSCGHLAEVLQDWLKAADLPVDVRTVVETEPLGRGGGLKYAAAQLPRPDKAWYATNGDIWTRFSLRDMADFHTERDAVATLALARPRIPWGPCRRMGSGMSRTSSSRRRRSTRSMRGVRLLARVRRAVARARGSRADDVSSPRARELRLAGFPIPQGAYWRAIDTAKDLTEAAKELAALGR